MNEPFAAMHPFEDLDLLVQPFRGDDDSDGLADDLGGRVAKHRRGCLIPRNDDAVQVFADDGVVGGFCDGREPRARRVGRHPRS